ncbi:MAG TPA: hypothetical protein VGF59_21515 [Bryobacteraceae bacterium]|jgi:hypothetical protein
MPIAHDHRFLSAALEGYAVQIQQIRTAIADIQARLVRTRSSESAPSGVRKRRRVSAAARRRMAAAQRKRWAGTGRVKTAKEHPAAKPKPRVAGQKAGSQTAAKRKPPTGAREPQAVRKTAQPRKLAVRTQAQAKARAAAAKTVLPATRSTRPQRTTTRRAKANPATVLKKVARKAVRAIKKAVTPETTAATSTPAPTPVPPAVSPLPEALPGPLA